MSHQTLKFSVPVLVIHGGAGNLDPSPEKIKQIDAALQKIVEETYPVLLSQGARASVLHGVRLLEDCPLFNAGTGSKIQSDGRIRMSASIMDNETGVFSGVINITDIRHPIDLADILSREKHTVLAGEPALRFARKKGFPFHDPATDERKAELLRKRKGETGTVGIVALDSQGTLCAGTSTGGVGNEIPGRVSDSPTVAGNYVSHTAGVTMTGYGEHIVNLSAASRITGMTDAGISLDKAIEMVLCDAQKRNYYFGLIAIDNKGKIHTGKTTRHLFFAGSDGDVYRSFLHI